LKDGAPGEIRTPDPLVRSQMLYPAELRARLGKTAAEILIIAETLRLMKSVTSPGDDSVDSNPIWQRPLRRFVPRVLSEVSPKYFLSRISTVFWHRSCQREIQNVNLSHHRKFLPGARRAPPLYFQKLEIGKADATRQDRRSGAQRGALEDKLRPEVFLDAPLHFPFFSVLPGRRQPSPSSSVGSEPQASTSFS
jgi:hypothetical protein